METQKLMNQLNGSDNELSNFATKKCYAILDKNGTNYGEGINNSTTIKFEKNLFAIIQMHLFL